MTLSFPVGSFLEGHLAPGGLARLKQSAGFAVLARRAQRDLAHARAERERADALPIAALLLACAKPDSALHTYCTL